MHKHFVLIVFLLVAFTSQAQTQEEKILQQVKDQEHARNAEIMRSIDEAVDLMNAGQYEQADKIFKEALKSSRVVPTDLTFYFGKNSYHLNKFKQCIDWLNKYIEIKGTSGQHYKECIDYLDKAKVAYLKVRESERKEAHTILTASYEIDCGPSGKVICPVCKGEGVIIQQGAFGNTYKSCPYSDDHGYLTCEQYNQLLRGELKPSGNQ